MQILLYLFCTSLLCNPFQIDFPDDRKEPLSHEDYKLIEQKLSTIKIDQIVDKWYPEAPLFSFPWTKSLAKKEDFKRRISKSLHQTLSLPNKTPTNTLIKINEGGDRCIVCYVTFDGKYEELAKKLPGALEKTGFNGHLLLMIGGYPNPTGKEIAYCGVPYCFKIFALLEAEKKGFSKVLWIDSAFIPLKDPSPLFEWIEKTGCFLKTHSSFKKFILPKTKKYLKNCTGVNVIKERYISAQVIGFDLKQDKCQEFIRQYYDMVALGYPFFSCFPEEYVFTALIGQKPYLWESQPFPLLVFSELKLHGKPISWVEKQGYFFLQKAH